MKKVLIIFAHPAMQRSRVNYQLVQGLNQVESVTFHDIYQAYPEFDIDVEYEKQLLTNHDVIIFHHPFFWYSTPAILKEWQDLVLEHGWAYGQNGNALKNKIFLNFISTGGGQEAYCEKGYNRFTIRQLIAPLEQTAYLCRMIFVPPYVIHGTLSITQDEINEHKKQYHNLLNLFVSEQFDAKFANTFHYLNDYLKNKQKG